MGASDRLNLHTSVILRCWKAGAEVAAPSQAALPSSAVPELLLGLVVALRNGESQLWACVSQDPVQRLMLKCVIDLLSASRLTSCIPCTKASLEHEVTPITSHEDPAHGSGGECGAADRFDDLTCDEMHAISAAFTVARERGFVTKAMNARHPNVVLVRTEARIAVRKARKNNLTREEIQRLAMNAVSALLERHDYRLGLSSSRQANQRSSRLR